MRISIVKLKYFNDFDSFHVWGWNRRIREIQTQNFHQRCNSSKLLEESNGLNHGDQCSVSFYGPAPIKLVEFNFSRKNLINKQHIFTQEVSSRQLKMSLLTFKNSHTDNFFLRNTFQGRQPDTTFRNVLCWPIFYFKKLNYESRFDGISNSNSTNLMEHDHKHG